MYLNLSPQAAKPPDPPDHTYSNIDEEFEKKVRCSSLISTVDTITMATKTGQRLYMYIAVYRQRSPPRQKGKVGGGGGGGGGGMV